MEHFIATILLFGGNFAPRGWALCQGQLLSIAQNTALFSLLGTTYGGNGQTTFALPDLRGRTPIGAGQGPGLWDVSLGEVSGSMTQTLNVNQIPAHVHQMSAATGDQTTNRPNAGAPARGGVYGAPNDFGTATSQAGGNQPFSIMQPYVGMNYIICLEGIYPSRN